MRHVLGSGLLLFAIAFGAIVRADAALTAENFDTESAAGMLRSDPALLFYLTSRVSDAGGGIPTDFGADPRIEYPVLTDVPATFTVGQEFVVAWCAPWFGEDVPLHVVCVWVMAVIASLAVVGVYGLALELTGRVRWACVAAALFVLIPANYRTIGFILVREDFSLPWFALFLWWSARAVRLQTRASIATAAGFGVLAAATWHASGFLITMAVACVFAWTLRSGQNPMGARRALLALLVAAIGGLLIPVLRAKGFVWSLPMLMLAALAVASEWRQRRGASRVPAGLILVAALVGLIGASMVLSVVTGSSTGDFAHVFDLMWSKVVRLGQLPLDPNELDFDVRLMWQGPFQSLSVERLHSLLAVGFWLSLGTIGVAARYWLAGRGDGRVATLGAFTVMGIAAALLVQRLQNLPGLLCAVAGAVALSRIAELVLKWRADPDPVAVRWARAAAAGLAVVTLVIQGVVFERHLRTLHLVWYDPPEQRQELASLLHWLPRVVPAGEAVAGDFVNSPAILAHLGYPIIAQPKWETAASRRRARDVLLTFNRGTPEELRRLLLDEYRCSYLVVDRRTLWGLGRYASGYPEAQVLPPPGTAAALFCSDDIRVLKNVPGFRLLYRSPAEIRDDNGLSSDWFRIYYVEP